jgi:hypothetical protein
MSDALPIHKRTLIGDAIVKTLKNKTIAKQNVAYSYTPKPSMENMPIVLVYAVSEQIEELSQAPRELRRNLFMSIECIADGSDDAEMTVRLDTLADQVEQLLSEDDTLNCTVDDIILNSIEFQFEGDDSETPIGSCRMAYLVKYREFMPREQVNVDSFDSINANWDISPEGKPDGKPEAEDVIEFNGDNQ